MFIRMLEIAKKSNEKDLIKFLEEVLSVYEKYDINGHIIWKKINNSLKCQRRIKWIAMEFIEESI